MRGADEQEERMAGKHAKMPNDAVTPLTASEMLHAVQRRQFGA